MPILKHSSSTDTGGRGRQLSLSMSYLKNAADGETPHHHLVVQAVSTATHARARILHSPCSLSLPKHTLFVQSLQLGIWFVVTRIVHTPHQTQGTNPGAPAPPDPQNLYVPSCVLRSIPPRLYRRLHRRHCCCRCPIVLSSPRHMPRAGMCWSLFPCTRTCA